MQFTSAQALTSTLQQLVVLMVSRYSCSLQEDQQLLQQRDSLAPRLAAAVTASSGEKEVWAELQQVGVVFLWAGGKGLSAGGLCGGCVGVCKQQTCVQRWYQESFAVPPVLAVLP